MSILQNYQEIIIAIVKEHNFNDAKVNVLAKALTPEEAIGKPYRRDFPILEGKERVVEAEIFGSRGQAFTDAPSDFSGKLDEVLNMPLTNNKNRAIFLAVSNALLSYLGFICGSIHCKDDAPNKCAGDFAAFLKKEKIGKVGLIGHNPALLEGIVEAIGAENTKITDLNPDNVGQRKFGVLVLNGKTQTKELIKTSDLILVTGTTLVNGTFDEILTISKVFNKRLVVFGISGAGVCKLMNFERWCFEAKNG